MSFVKGYYRYSPPVADFIRKHDTLRAITRWLLTPLIWAVKYPNVTGSLVLGLLLFCFRGVRRSRTESVGVTN